MFGAYTEAANERLDSFLECDAAEVWNSLFSQTQSASIEQWRQKLEHIAGDYMLSSRFVLMRMLHKRAYDFCQAENTHFYPADSDPKDWPDAFCASENAFKVRVRDAWITFSDISLEHAQNLSAAENMQYITYLSEIAAASADAQEADDLILRAWHTAESANLIALSQIPEKILADQKKLEKHREKICRDNKKKYGKRLTREEALKLGHLLGFRMDEMKCFLMRVFSVEDAFRMNQSEDLIETYCFTLQKSWKDAQRLKEAYTESAQQIEKTDGAERHQNWTAQVAGSLSARIEEWARQDNCDQLFLEWLKGQAHGLDVPSYTARKIYRNLAVYAYKLAIGKAYISDESELLDRIQEICRMESDNPEFRYYLGDAHGAVSPEKGKALAETLLLENKERSESPMSDKSHAWAVLTVLQDGTLSSRPGLIDASRTRVLDLLLGTAQVEKGDLLYLIWFICNVAWYDSNDPDDNTLCCRIYDLKDAADLVLETADLPAFYAPHLMEQSMLLSILCGGKAHIHPGELYACVIMSIKDSRKRKKTEA